MVRGGNSFDITVRSNSAPVRFGSEADVCSASINVRYGPISDIGRIEQKAPKKCRGFKFAANPLTHSSLHYFP
jgi:hypothetical protein